MSLNMAVTNPQNAKNNLIKLSAFKEQAEKDLANVQNRLKKTEDYLKLADKVTEALEKLNQQLFRELLDVIEEKLTIALQEILEQPIKLKANIEWKRNAASVDFWIERDGNREDILKGQGGSVTNILSVGLRLFALTTLDQHSHRRFLALDEQDCWLQPKLVPRLVKIVYEAGQALGFQVLMISHHDAGYFKQYADKIYRLVPQTEKGVNVVLEYDAKDEI